MIDCIAASMPFHSTAPARHQLLSDCCWDCPAGRDVEPLSKRYLALRTAALSHPAWGEQWGRYKPATIARFLARSDVRLERLELLIEHGQQGSYSMSTVVTMTDAHWRQALQKLELQGGAPGVHRPQDTEVR